MGSEMCIRDSYGIDSVMAPMDVRKKAWARLAANLDTSLLESVIQEIGLNEVESAGADVLAGKIRGRLVVDVNRF